VSANLVRLNACLTQSGPHGAAALHGPPGARSADTESDETLIAGRDGDRLMRVLILSLPSVAGWGGSEELWAETARVALEAGHQVWITPRLDVDRRDTPVRGLVEAGAVVLPRNPGTTTGRGLRAEVVPVAASRVASAADAILLNAGGSVRELLHPDVLRLVRQCRPCRLFLLRGH
jgi:hypothetical protein